VTQERSPEQADWADQDQPEQVLRDLRRLQDGRLLRLTRHGGDVVLDVAYVRGLVPHRSVAGHTEYESARLDFGRARLVCERAMLEDDAGEDVAGWDWLAERPETDPDRVILWAERNGERLELMLLTTTLMVRCAGLRLEPPA
jgi:hypothetical protein